MWYGNQMNIQYNKATDPVTEIYTHINAVYVWKIPSLLYLYNVTKHIKRVYIPIIVLYSCLWEGYAMAHAQSKAPHLVLANLTHLWQQEGQWS